MAPGRGANGGRGRGALPGPGAARGGAALGGARAPGSRSPGSASSAEPPAIFRTALARLRSARLRPEVVLEDAPAPQRLAPFSVALTADVVLPGAEAELATGRLVLLHDPDGHEAWHGTLRLVTFVRAELEPEMAADPLLTGVGWSWLIEALETRGAEYAAASGTVTRVTSESFGTLGGPTASAESSSTAQVEVRASWTPLDDALERHLEAWGELLCTVAGLPPVPAGVRAMPSRGLRRPR
jgi:DUF3000 family protein